MDINFKNKLNLDIDAFFKYTDSQGVDDRRGVGKDSTGKLISRVPSNDALPLYKSGLGDEFELHIEMEEIPVKDRVKGVKVIPGSGLGPAHHVEFHERDDHYLVVIHYKHSGRGPEIHVDPEVSHPEPPNP